MIGITLTAEQIRELTEDKTGLVCPLHNSLTSTAVCVYIPLLATLFWPFVSLQVPILVTCDISAGMQQCI